ncbi:MAG: M6 family metalloprotease domain-containing protein [Candidatus Cryptobacteroides sp.]
MNVLKPRTFAKLCSVFLTFFAFTLTINAAPARRGPVVMTQPDGSTFTAQLRGDEFMKIKTTIDGYAIIQGEDGWWYYGIYDAQARLGSTGVKVGGKAPSESRNIPFAQIVENAKKFRTSFVRSEGPLLQRVMHQNGVVSKAGTGTAEKHGIIILAAFKDVAFKYTKENFENLLNTKSNSAKKYFNDQLKGTVNFSFDVSDIVTLPQNRSYYGGNNYSGNDKNPAQMVVDACTLASSAGIDFSTYDDDGDGEVDNVFIFFAGEDEAEGGGDDCIWSHAWYVRDGAGKTCYLNGKMINSYACTSELTRVYTSQTRYTSQLAGIGTFCHEYTHTFGVADMYDTDYDEAGKQAAALWMDTNLMDGGNSNDNGNTPPNYSAIQYDELGTFAPVVISRDGTYTLEPINKNGQYYRIDCDASGEYYLLECRKASGWDSFIGGSGLLIYHIDKSQTTVSGVKAIDRWNYQNSVNAYAAHQCADLIEANGASDQFSSQQAFYNAYRSLQTAALFFPYMGTNSFQLKNWSGNAHPITIKGIKKVDDNIEFTIEGTGNSVAVPEVKNTRIDSFQYEAIITFSSSLSVEGADAYIAYKRAGTGTFSEKIKVEPYATGKYAYRLKGLEAENASYNLQIWFENGDVQSKTVQLSIMTSRTGEYPFIHLSCQTTAVSRNDDGTFKSGAQLPLVVYNVEKDSETEWFFDDKAIDPGKACFYTVTKSGELKAVVHNADGSSEVVVKHITVK